MKHDAHVKKYHRYLYQKTFGSISSSVLFLFILIVLFIGFYLGVSYAFYTHDLFSLPHKVSDNL